MYKGAACDCASFMMVLCASPQVTPSSKVLELLSTAKTDSHEDFNAAERASKNLLQSILGKKSNVSSLGSHQFYGTFSDTVQCSCKISRCLFSIPSMLRVAVGVEDRVCMAGSEARTVAPKQAAAHVPAPAHRPAPPRDDRAQKEAQFREKAQLLIS